MCCFGELRLVGVAQLLLNLPITPAVPATVTVERERLPSSEKAAEGRLQFSRKRQDFFDLTAAATYLLVATRLMEIAQPGRLSAVMESTFPTRDRL